jgi:hypothetical protein
MEPPVVDYVFEKENASGSQILIEELANVLATRVRLNDDLGLEPEWTKFRSVSPPAITIQAYLQRYDQHPTLKFSHCKKIDCALGEDVPYPCSDVIPVALTFLTLDAAELRSIRRAAASAFSWLRYILMRF